MWSTETVADVVIAANGTTLSRWTSFTTHRIEANGPDAPTRADRGRQKARTSAQTPGSPTPAAILLAAEQMGAATKCLDLTVDLHQGSPSSSAARSALSRRSATEGARPVRGGSQSAHAVVNDAIAEPSPTSAELARSRPARRSRKVAAERPVPLHGWHREAPGSMTFSCTSSVPHGKRHSCSGRRVSICVASNPKCSSRRSQRFTACQRIAPTEARSGCSMSRHSPAFPAHAPRQRGPTAPSRARTSMVSSRARLQTAVTISPRPWLQSRNLVVAELDRGVDHTFPEHRNVWARAARSTGS